MHDKNPDHSTQNGLVNADEMVILSPPHMKMFQHYVIPRLDRGIQAKSKTGELDSGFRRNDRKTQFPTFCEVIDS